MTRIKPHYMVGDGVTALTGYFRPKGSTGLIRGTLWLTGEGPVVKQRIRSGKSVVVIDWKRGSLEPFYASPSATTGAMSRVDWAGGINRFGVKSAGVIGLVALGTKSPDKVSGVWTSATKLADEFHNVRILPAEEKDAIRRGLLDLWEQES